MILRILLCAMLISTYFSAGLNIEEVIKQKLETCNCPFSLVTGATSCASSSLILRGEACIGPLDPLVFYAPIALEFVSGARVFYL